MSLFHCPRWLKWLIWPVLVIGIAGGAFLLLRPEPVQEAGYHREAVRLGTLERTITSTGTLAAVDTVEVGTQISGTIEQLRVDYNDKVQKGDVLARIDAALYEAALTEADAGVEKARATLDEALDDLQREQPLFDKGYLSAQEFAPTRTAVATARAALASAEASRLRARTNLDYTVIRSPIDGIVIKRSVEVGQTVAASLNTPTLFIIARDLSRMQIEVNVDESDIGQIRQGQQARFTVQAWPEEKFAGSVRQVRLQPTTISNVVNYTVLVEASNDRDLLLPGMTATVDFVVDRRENVLLVPNAALRFVPEGVTPEKAGKGKSSVYILGPGGGPQPLAVTRGESDGISTIVDGEAVREGLEVITGVDAAAATKRSTNIFSFMRPQRPRSGSR